MKTQTFLGLTQCCCDLSNSINHRILVTVRPHFLLHETIFALMGIKITATVLSRVNVYLTFRMLLYFRISNSVMLSSDNGNILIIGFSFQGTVLNVFFSVFNVIRYNSNGIL